MLQRFSFESPRGKEFLTKDGWVTDGAAAVAARYVRELPEQEAPGASVSTLLKQSTGWVQVFDLGFRHKEHKDQTTVFLHPTYMDFRRVAAIVDFEYLKIAQACAFPDSEYSWECSPLYLYAPAQSDLSEGAGVRGPIVITAEQTPELKSAIMVLMVKYWEYGFDGVFEVVELATSNASEADPVQAEATGA